MPTSQLLALINATIVTISGLVIIFSLRNIRAGKKDTHMKSMIMAIILMGVFLSAYLYRFVTYGITPFPGSDWSRWIYFPLLASHVIVAAVSTPMIIMTVLAARKGDWARHRHLARRVTPLWLYVAGTGPMVYIMLYSWFPVVILNP